MKQNYDLLMEKEIKKIVAEGKKPRLLLHSCCAPCSCAVIEYLLQYFELTVFFYNPNITFEDEYKKDWRSKEIITKEKGIILR